MGTLFSSQRRQSNSGSAAASSAASSTTETKDLHVWLVGIKAHAVLKKLQPLNDFSTPDHLSYPREDLNITFHIWLRPFMSAYQPLANQNPPSIVLLTEPSTARELPQFTQALNAMREANIPCSLVSLEGIMQLSELSEPSSEAASMINVDQASETGSQLDSDDEASVTSVIEGEPHPAQARRPLARLPSIETLAEEHDLDILVAPSTRQEIPSFFEEIYNRTQPTANAAAGPSAAR